MSSDHRVSRMPNPFLRAGFRPCDHAAHRFKRRRVEPVGALWPPIGEVSLDIDDAAFADDGFDDAFPVSFRPEHGHVLW